MKTIMVSTGARKAFAAYPPKGQQTFEGAVLDLSPLIKNNYARITLIDVDGNRAWSQPIYEY